MKSYDVVVIGTGTAGQTAALELAGEGYDVAIVESSREPGGVCALHGCQAKKWFYEATESVARCSHLLNKGVTSLPGVEWEQVLAEKNAFTAKIPENTVKNLRGNGVEYIEGSGKFVDAATLLVEGQQIQGKYVIIATGASPMSLPMEGADMIITSNDFLALKKLPRRIVFVGGGFISFEFSHFAARLGAEPEELFILEANERVLGPFDGDMVEQLQAATTDAGIRVRTGVSVEKIVKDGDGFRVKLGSGETIVTDLVVNGAGRRPRIDDLRLKDAGIEYSSAGVAVDTSMRTSNPRVFAVGDCAATVQLARVADKEAKTAARTIAAELEGTESAAIEYDTVPAVLFTYPQLGMVGKTEEQLKEEKIRYWKSFDTQLSWPTYRRVGMKHAAYKILVGEDDRILGAHFLSDNATGLVFTFAQAMRNRTTVAELHESAILAPYPSRESDIIYMLGALVE